MSKTHKKIIANLEAFPYPLTENREKWPLASVQKNQMFKSHSNIVKNKCLQGNLKPVQSANISTITQVKAIGEYEAAEILQVGIRASDRIQAEMSVSC